LRIYAMRADWDGLTHSNQNVTPHSEIVTFTLPSCNPPTTTTTTTTVAPTTYSVTYNGNTNGSGSVPVDATAYASGATVTVAGNTGTLAKTGYTFDGWCTTQPAAGAACTGTSRAAASTFAITTNTTLHAVWTGTTCATGAACIVGDTGPGGGIVFYVAGANFTSTGSDCGTACRYLEAEPTPSPSRAAQFWCSVNTSIGASVRFTAIGTGMSNTNNADATCSSGAIQIALDYERNSKTDWHLPSFEELRELYNQRNLAGIDIGSPAVYYWSSTEQSVGGGIAARAYRFNDGAENFSLGKTGLTAPMRVIRAFG
jgi:hypothetical protein